MPSLHLLWDLHGVPQASASPDKCSGGQYKFERHWHNDINQSQPKRTVREAQLGPREGQERKGRQPVRETGGKQRVQQPGGQRKPADE